MRSVKMFLWLALLAGCGTVDPTRGSVDSGPSVDLRFDGGHSSTDAGTLDGGAGDAGAGELVDGGSEPVCGNGLVEAGELCDGNCPASCDDGVACTADSLEGDPSRCSATCRSVAIEACSSDGCCAPGCSTANDADCSASCGNGTVEPGEVCDGASCPTSCDDGDACTADTLVGSASNCSAACAATQIVACSTGDGCCPSGCDQLRDADCFSVCGNGVVEAGETCDGACPSACDDGDACTTDILVGTARTCTAQCTSTAVGTCRSGDGCCAAGCDAQRDSDCAPTCGNGVIEPGETCEGSSCPSSCDDGRACTTDRLVGSARTCTASCTAAEVTICRGSDGCCPSDCSWRTDSDCSPICGDGVVEGRETCDGNCPTSCNDGNACTFDFVAGSAARCDATCSTRPVVDCTPQDGCCPAGCAFPLDTDCAPRCPAGARLSESGQCVAVAPVPCTGVRVPEDYAQIGAAIDAIVADPMLPSTICVAPGTYRGPEGGPLVLTRTIPRTVAARRELTLVSTVPLAARIESELQVRGSFRITDPTTFTVRGFTIRAATIFATRTGGTIVLENNHVRERVTFADDESAGELLVQTNVFVRNNVFSAGAQVVHGSQGHASIVNNTFVGAGTETAVDLTRPGVSALVQNNLFFRVHTAVSYFRPVPTVRGNLYDQVIRPQRLRYSETLDDTEISGGRILSAGLDDDFPPRPRRAAAQVGLPPTPATDFWGEPRTERDPGCVSVRPE